MIGENDPIAVVFKLTFRFLMLALALDFLAHTLGVPMNEVPEIEAWDDSLSVDMVSLIIDGLQPMYKGKGKGEF